MLGEQPVTLALLLASCMQGGVSLRGRSGIASVQHRGFMKSAGCAARNAARSKWYVRCF